MGDEDRIGHVLHELGRGEPPPGMERRITRALEERLEARAGARAWSPARLLLLGGAGAAAVATMLLLVPVLSRRASTPVHTQPQPVAAVAPVPGTAVEQERGLQPGRAAASVAPLAAAQRPLAKREAAYRRSHGAIKGDPELVDASYAPTLVAPPEPLTPQEQLLVRVVRRGNAEQKAALDPRLRDAQLVAEKAEVDAFFKPPALPKQDQ